MEKNKYILNNWYKTISEYPKLNLNQAKEIYMRIVNSQGSKKELLREELIKGTLYLIPNFIKSSMLYDIKSNKYDMNDVISISNELWINMIDNGKLLEISYYSQLLNRTFYVTVVEQLVPKHNFSDIVGINIEMFFDLLFWYIKRSTAGVLVDYKILSNHIDDLLEIYENNHNTILLNSNRIIIYEFIFKIYEYLSKENLIDNNTSERQILAIKNIIIDNMLDISYNNASTIEDKDYNLIYLNNALEETILNIIFNEMPLKANMKEKIKYRYGLEDGRFKTLVEAGKQYGISKAGMLVCENSAFKKIRKREIMDLLEDYFYIK